MEKLLLSLDLGKTTGYAVIQMKPGEQKTLQIVETDNIAHTVYQDTLKNLMRRWLISYSVAEKPVIFRGELGDILQDVILDTSQVLMRQVDFVNPSDWKATPYKNYPIPETKPPSSKLSPHQKDAIRLGVWYANTRLQGNK